MRELGFGRKTSGVASLFPGISVLLLSLVMASAVFAERGGEAGLLSTIPPANASSALLDEVAPNAAGVARVSYSINSESGFIGEAKGESGSTDPDAPSFAPVPLDAAFSATARIDGSMDILIILNNRDRVFRGYVDTEGHLMRLRSETFGGKRAPLEREDREELKALARAMKASYDDRTRVRERFGTFANFLIAMAPEGIPVDIRFIKQERIDPKTGEAVLDKCMDFSSSVFRKLLGKDFVEDIRGGKLSLWLSVRGWRYDSDLDAICGLRNTRLCRQVGEIYHGTAGYVTTAPLMSILNPFEPPHETLYYGGNLVPIGVIGRIPFTSQFEFCPGRCGPGCGNLSGDYFNSSVFNFTAECFAHDACIGEVGQGSDWFPTLGAHGSCADELINACWGFNNGAPCNTATKADLVGWWQFDKELFMLDAARTFRSWAGGAWKIEGNYVVNTSGTGRRWILLRQEGYFGPSGIYVGDVSSDRPFAIDGSSTTDNLTATPFSAYKISLTGFVLNKLSKKPLPLRDVFVTVEGDTLDKTKKQEKTDANGYFAFHDMSPHDSYKIRFVKNKVLLFEDEGIHADARPDPQTYPVMPPPFNFTTTNADGRIDWSVWGLVDVWVGGWIDDVVQYSWYLPPEDGTPVRFSAKLTPYTCCPEKNASHTLFLHNLGTMRTRALACSTTATLSYTKEFVLSGESNFAAAFFASCSPPYGFVQVTLNPYQGEEPAPSRAGAPQFPLLPPGALHKSPWYQGTFP